MPRPGADIVIADDNTPGGAVLDTGQTFFAGQAERGPIDAAVQVNSFRHYKQLFGNRTGGSLLYDAVYTYFAEGGTVLFVTRIVGNSGVAASLAFADGTVRAANPGAWGNDVDVVLLDGVITVVDDGVTVEESPVLTTMDDAVEWALGSSDYIRFTRGALNALPANGTFALATGVDDNVWTDPELATALGRFVDGLGPGQVAMPGMTTLAAHTALLAHAESFFRVALLDLPDTDNAVTLESAVEALYELPGARFGAAFAPWALVPAEVGPLIRTVPYSALQAAMIARSDMTRSPNEPAAGSSGLSRFAVGLSQDFTDDEHTDLNEAGVTLAKMIYGDVRTYGGRTVMGPDEPNWMWFGNSRVVMAIGHEADAIAEEYVLKQIDGRGHIFTKLEGALKAMLLRFYQTDALYGPEPSEAFSVNTGPTVNTPLTIAAGEVRAVIRIKTSPTAEWVQLTVVKVPVEATL